MSKDGTDLAHCLNCLTDYPRNRSAHCPHRSVDDPREIERVATLKRRCEAKAKARVVDWVAAIRELRNKPPPTVDEATDAMIGRAQQGIDDALREISGEFSTGTPDG